MFTLSPQEARVLGSLIEKQMTTPEYYPMTVNALVAACNQRTNREPVVDYDDEMVEGALRSLNERYGLTSYTRTVGARALKYVHKAGVVLAVDDQQLALIAVLLLRGPQTPGELRARTDRYVEFSGADSVEQVLDDLVSRDTPLVAELARGPGQREERFRCLLVEWDPNASGTRRQSGLEERINSLEERLGRIEAALGISDS